MILACTKAISVLAPMIEFQVVEKTNKLELDGRPFQILGFDVEVDADLNAWVTGITHDPNLRMHLTLGD